MNVKKVSTAQLKKVWNKYKNEEKPAPVFAQQLKRTAAELKRRGEKLEENKMFKFDKAVKSIMESVKLLKEGPEMSMEFYEDFPQIPVKSIIPDDTTGGVFILHGEATAEYDVYGGGGDGWNTPYYDDEAEVQEITWDDMVLKRDNYSNEDKYAGKTYDYDTELIIVKPEDIGQENYDKAIQILKAQAEDALVKKVERKGVQHAKDTWSP